MLHINSSLAIMFVFHAEVCLLSDPKYALSDSRYARSVILSMISQ